MKKVLCLVAMLSLFAGAASACDHAVAVAAPTYVAAPACPTQTVAVAAPVYHQNVAVACPTASTYNTVAVAAPTYGNVNVAVVHPVFSSVVAIHRTFAVPTVVTGQSVVQVANTATVVQPVGVAVAPPVVAVNVNRGFFGGLFGRGVRVRIR